MPATAKKKPAPRKTSATKMAAPDKMIGKSAPDFDLPATKTGSVSRAGLKGKPYVLYFYPKDDTSGCTAEACDFRDNIPTFKKLGIAVIGVSKDSLQRHEKFSAKYDLNFPLASDEKSKMCEAFGVYVEKSMYGRKYMGIERSTFLIDAKGIVRNAWRKVSVTGHVAEVAKAIKEL
jgi:peroxiredoxin Q/BCP